MAHSIDSKYTNYTYTIDVYIPDAKCPDEGFPVIYVLDGLSYFELVKKGIELQSKNEIKTKVQPAIVVGINHDRKTMRQRRFYDFTAPAKEYNYPARMHGKEPEKAGGARDFHLFIEKELKPIIHQSYHVNKRNETLFGHSLGGYFTLWSLFHHSNDFTNYVAISPSIWWNDYELKTMVDLFISKNGTCESLFLGVGELEGFMVRDALNVYEKLHNYGLHTSFYEALDENHASVVPTVLSRALRFCNVNSYKKITSN